MYGFKKYLVSLIPLFLLTIGSFAFCYFSFGIPNMFEDWIAILVIGPFMGLSIQLAFFNNEETHPFWKVLLWIGFTIVGLLTLITPLSTATNTGVFDNYPLGSHVAIGLTVGNAVTLIYLFVMLCLRFGEDHMVISKIIVPIILFIGGIIGGGYLRNVGYQLCNTLVTILVFSPLGVVIVLIIIFAKASLMGNGGGGGGSYSSSSSNSYSHTSYDDTDTSINEDEGPSESEIWHALYGLYASGASGCVVTLKITDVFVYGDSVQIEYEEKVEHTWHGNEDYDQALYFAKTELFKKAKQKLRAIGSNLDIY